MQVSPSDIPGVTGEPDQDRRRKRTSKGGVSGDEEEWQTINGSHADGWVPSFYEIE